MPRTKEQNKAIREERKQSIMDIALQLFAENGFENTSIANIAKHARISQGLVYSYFESKDDLLYQILTSGMQKIEADLSPEMTMEDFLASADKILSHILENKQFFKLYNMLSMQPKVTQRLSNLANEYNALINMMTLFQNKFGEAAMQEMLLASIIFKGFSIVASFGDMQKVYQVDTLKNVVMDFLKERYIINNNFSKNIIR